MGRLAVSFQRFRARSSPVRVPVQHLVDALVESVPDLAMRRQDPAACFSRHLSAYLDESEDGLSFGDRPLCDWQVLA
jgi:hypothetical protein